MRMSEIRVYETVCVLVYFMLLADTSRNIPSFHTRAYVLVNQNNNVNADFLI